MRSLTSATAENARRHATGEGSTSFRFKTARPMRVRLSPGTTPDVPRTLSALNDGEALPRSRPCRAASVAVLFGTGPAGGQTQTSRSAHVRPGIRRARSRRSGPAARNGGDIGAADGTQGAGSKGDRASKPRNRTEEFQRGEMPQKSGRGERGEKLDKSSFATPVDGRGRPGRVRVPFYGQSLVSGLRCRPAQDDNLSFPPFLDEAKKGSN